MKLFRHSRNFLQASARPNARGVRWESVRFVAAARAKVAVEEVEKRRVYKTSKELKALYPSQVIDGSAVAAALRSEITEATEALIKESQVTPGLGVLLVGERPDSMSYVRSKQKFAKQMGFHTFDVHLPETATEDEIVQAVQEMNENKDVHGILVQLPLPEGVNKDRVLGQIKVEKDVDGFCAENIGRLGLRGGAPPSAVPCTPAGCAVLINTGVPLQENEEPLNLRGKRVCVVGRSNIVGMPMGLILQAMDCTVSTVHRWTKEEDRIDILGKSDVIVAAVGIPEFIKAEWVKPGAIIIDVGINSIQDETAKKGHRIVGDVQTEECLKKGCKVSPVPGGVGPMTIAMLLMNTLNLTRQSVGLERINLRQS